VRAVSDVIGKRLPYDTIEALRERLATVNPVFATLSHLPRFGCSDQSGPVGDPNVLSYKPLVSPLRNYYQTDPISRSSPTTAACVSAQAQPALAAE